MYGYFTFEVQPSNTPNRSLVIFCATPEPNADAVITVIRNYGQTKLSPDRIILLGLASEQDILTAIAADQHVKDQLPLHTRNANPPAVQAAAIPRTGVSLDEEVVGIPWREIRFAGLATIFKKRNALLIAPSTHHFEKPSTRHCDRFIRAANVLVDGAEITFIAACSLGFVQDTVRHFYCDTGGISVVAFAIDSLRRRFNPAMKAATVNTFESYTGLKTFVFQESEASVVLLSASTSGGLESEICKREQRFRPEQIVTIFSLGTHDIGSQVLLDLEANEELRLSLGDFTSYEHSRCPLCRRGSIAVPMMGDQFIPVRSETKSVLLTKGDSPLWLPRFLESFAAHESLRAFYRSPNTQHAANDVFIDLERTLADANTSFTKRVDRLLVQSVPSALRRIVHLDDRASQLLAERIAAGHRRIHPADRAVEVIAARVAAEQIPLNFGASVVVAAAAASGQSLLAVSQTLRDLQKNGAITYLIALTRMATAKEVEKLERDLRMGESVTDYAFAVAERINLPLVGRNADCSWNDELTLLEEWANPADGPLREALEARIDVLRNAQNPAQRGLANKLFWSSSGGQELVLRNGFVFFPKSVNPTAASQGDVYFTIASVLHNLRCSIDPKSSLRQTEYERRVLSPLCFDRFNDGVVQAALLRAAVPPELDYSASPEESQRMAAVLRSIFAASNAQKGEANREFLLSMVQGRTLLFQADMQSLHQEFSHRTSDPVSERMWTEIQSKYLQ